MSSAVSTVKVHMPRAQEARALPTPSYFSRRFFCVWVRKCRCPAAAGRQAPVTQAAWARAGPGARAEEGEEAEVGGLADHLVRLVLQAPEAVPERAQVHILRDRPPARGRLTAQRTDRRTRPAWSSRRREPCPAVRGRARPEAGSLRADRRRCQSVCMHSEAHASGPVVCKLLPRTNTAAL